MNLGDNDRIVSGPQEIVLVLMAAW
jgi:hypothetical protein